MPTLAPERAQGANNALASQAWLDGSNLYSSFELILIRWVELSYECVSLAQQPQASAATVAALAAGQPPARRVLALDKDL